jgi:hypothetical protein
VKRQTAVLVLILSTVSSGCSMMAVIDRAPKECGQVFDRARCLAMADVASAEVGKTRADVAVLAIVPNPEPERERKTLGGGAPIHLTFTLTDGTVHETRICGLLSLAPACTSNPRLAARSIRSAYTDVPCAGPAPDGCATPVPSVEPEALDASSPVAIDVVRIPIAKQGLHEIRLGEGSLPNGILSEASFEFAEEWPEDVALKDGTAWLGVRSLEPGGKAVENIYTHGWRPGIERFSAILTFEVLWFAPGATLEVRKVVVR